MQYFVLSAVLFLILLIFSIVGIFICTKFYNSQKEGDTKERRKVIQTILKTYALVQCVGWPLLMSWAWVFYVNRPRFNSFGTGFMQAGITSLRFLHRLLRDYIGFNSFIIALCRYTFIFKDDMVIRTGITKIQQIFISSSVSFPLLLALICEATNPIEHLWFCLFVPNQSIQKNNSSDDSITFCNQDTVIRTFESPINTFFEENLPLPFRYPISIIHFIMIVIVHSNILEGIMYLHVYIYYLRYTYTFSAYKSAFSLLLLFCCLKRFWTFYRSQNKPTLQAMLTEEYKLKRHKQTKVSIQMTVISWSLEFLTGLLNMTAMYISRNEETNVDVIMVIVIVDTSLNFILIPSTYVFNNEMNKTFIMAEGWWKIITRCFRSNRVQPAAPENDYALEENAN